MILCGGSGERLWPASRPWRPKPFLPLIDERSSFQHAALRAQGLAEHGGEVVVLGGEGHGELIVRQLAEVGVAATVLLEPEARNTGPAIAAAAAWVAARAREAIVAILPADHHIPDAEAFQAAVRATLTAAGEGAIVTLGVRPGGPSSAYGYIRPAVADAAVKPIAGFVEKPDEAAARAAIAGGALWNTGTFVAKAEILLAETARWAPEVAEAARAALSGAKGGRLGPGFSAAPKIAFDRAVMERTDRGAVLPVDFEWSDLGAWDAVLAASTTDAAGNSLGEEASAPGSSQVLVRAAPGIKVAVVGASRLAVVVEPDGVLVCGLDASQAVREIDGARPARFSTLAAAADWYDGWLRTAALPLWATVGVDPSTGAFREALTWRGVPDDPWRRARVQARQTFVFARAAADGLDGPWLAAAEAGFGFFRERARQADGLYSARLDLFGASVESAAGLYDHAFVLLALAGLRGATGADGPEREALALLSRLASFRHDRGGFREIGSQPFQANALMHLLEAALEWDEGGGDGVWSALADELAGLALRHLIDPATGALREFFTADWAPLGGEGGLVEPGHQFEWAWLLERWGVSRGDAEARAAARRLFAVGRRGFDPARCVVVNELWNDLSVRESAARLWPQTEHLKAALILGEDAAALEAANGLYAYLDTPAKGVWRERMRADGSFVDESSPATSLYHLFLAARALAPAKPC